MPPIESTKNHSQMTREVAGLKRKLANKRLEDDLENCKVGLEEDFSHSTDLTLSLNPLNVQCYSYSSVTQLITERKLRLDWESIRSSPRDGSSTSN